VFSGYLVVIPLYTPVYTPVHPLMTSPLMVTAALFDAEGAHLSLGAVGLGGIRNVYFQVGHRNVTARLDRCRAPTTCVWQAKSLFWLKLAFYSARLKVSYWR